MTKLFALLSASLLALGSAAAAPPTGVPAGGGGRPDFAGSGRPDFAGSASSTAGSQRSSSASTRGNASNAGSFPSNSNAGGNALSHASPTAQPTLQVLDQAFSEGDISLIRNYFTTRAHENKPDIASPGTTTAFKKGQKLSASYLAEPLPADLLAQLPSRPGLTYVKIGSDILLLAGPDDVIVDIIPGGADSTATSP